MICDLGGFGVMIVWAPKLPSWINRFSKRAPGKTLGDRRQPNPSQKHPKLMRSSLTPAVACLSLAFALCGGGAAHAADPKSYPLTTCVVSGEKLGTMGKPFVHTVDGREVQFCCKACLKEFNKDTKKFLKKLDDASKPKA